MRQANGWPASNELKSEKGQEEENKKRMMIINNDNYNVDGRALDLGVNQETKY